MIFVISFYKPTNIYVSKMFFLFVLTVTNTMYYQQSGALFKIKKQIFHLQKNKQIKLKPRDYRNIKQNTPRVLIEAFKK